MRLIIAGSRGFHELRELQAAVRWARKDWSWPEIDEVVSGGAAGVDRLGELYAEEEGIPVKLFPADWGKHGKAAGPIRNREMAEYADALVAVWDGSSRGTKNMIDEATKRGLKVYVHRITAARGGGR